jgi:hypothetical protein
MTSTGTRKKAPELFHQLAFIGDDDHALGAGGDDFFVAAAHRRPPLFSARSELFRLVGAIDTEV